MLIKFIFLRALMKVSSSVSAAQYSFLVGLMRNLVTAILLNHFGEVRKIHLDIVLRSEFFHHHHLKFHVSFVARQLPDQLQGQHKPTV